MILISIFIFKHYSYLYSTSSKLNKCHSTIYICQHMHIYWLAVLSLLNYAYYNLFQVITINNSSQLIHFLCHFNFDFTKKIILLLNYYLQFKFEHQDISLLFSKKQIK